MFLRWFYSSAYRSACATRKHYSLLLAGQRDLLSTPALTAVQAAMDELSAAMKTGHSGRIRIKIEELQFAGHQWITPFPHPLWRGNIEVMLVALVVALGIRTFFVQPFKIPTGSMQPTLDGVTTDSLINVRSFRVPQGWDRVKDWLRGISYVHAVAQTNGLIERVGMVSRFLTVNIKQSFWIGGVEHRIWFPPDVSDGAQGIAPLIFHPNWFSPHHYRIGEDVIKIRRSCGDFLFADRLTYNFRKPERGEIVVFKTQGIAEEARFRYGIPADEFYIKRLVGLPGERVQIGNDHHLLVDDQRLDASTPHFAKVYSFDPHQSPREQPYLGHLNGWVARQYRLSPGFAPLFPDPDTVLTNGPNECLVMGDNTLDSLDSRYWGTIEESDIVGKCCFVFWPFTQRFGWGNE